jgi:glycosyltransferase involved in cell wall biosynthesis
LRILFLSWRDPEHPKSGGAELFTYELARRLVAKGDTVEWFTAMFPGAARETTLAGIRIVRGGRQSTVHLAAFRRYRKRLKGSFDAVIDEVNTIPFFTPLWADVPRLLLIFQLAREVWWYEGSFPVNALGYATEPLYLRVYQRTAAATISASTEADLKGLGFRAPITVLPIGLEPIDLPTVAKAVTTTFLYVGRMTKSKRVDDIVRAFGLYRDSQGSGELWLVGDGPPDYTEALHKQVQRLDLTGSVKFLGRLDTKEKHRLMASAHVLLMASVREGWGLTVAEANACGTPAIAYDVPGLRDSVRDGQTGLVVPASPECMAEGMIRLATQPDLYSALAAEAKRWASSFSFDASAGALREAIIREMNRTGQPTAKL